MTASIKAGVFKDKGKWIAYVPHSQKIVPYYRNKYNTWDEAISYADWHMRSLIKRSTYSKFQNGEL